MSIRDELEALASDMEGQSRYHDEPSVEPDDIARDEVYEYAAGRIRALLANSPAQVVTADQSGRVLYEYEQGLGNPATNATARVPWSSQTEQVRQSWAAEAEDHFRAAGIEVATPPESVE